MPRGAVPASSDRLDGVAFTVRVEQAPYPLVWVESDAPSCERRAGFAGPLGEHAELLEAVAAHANHRGRMNGAPRQLLAGT